MRFPLYLDGGEELAESLVLLADLEGELPGVAHHQHGDLAQREGHLQHERGSSSAPPVRRPAQSAGAWPARTRQSCPCRTWPGTRCPSPTRPGKGQGYWRLYSTKSDEGGGVSTIFYLGDALVLDFRGMLEPTVHDGTEDLADN